MNLVYIGAGFVGACSAAVAADSGHRVLVYDINQEKIKKLESGDRDLIESYLSEKGLGDILVRNKKQISFTGDYKEVEDFFEQCDAIFLCLPTPEIEETGASDLSYYISAIEQLAGVLAERNNGQQTKYVLIINKSTVPVNAIDTLNELLIKAGVKNFGSASNPEFLVEGKAIDGTLKPDRVVVGADKEKDFLILRQIYSRFCDSPTTRYLEVNPKEAAAGKLMANFYLSIRLSACFDVLGRVCEAFEGLKFENVRKIVSSDKRIGEWGFFDSLYAGGSCLIKDARSLAHQMKSAGKNNTLIMEIFLANKRQLETFIGRAEKEVGIKWPGKKVAVLGLAFKRDTNDVRNSPAIEVINFLKQNGVEKIYLYDPAAMENFKLVFPDLPEGIYCDNETTAVENADLVIIASDWPQFRGLAEILLPLKNRPLIMDGRRILQHKYDDLIKAGFDIIAVGSPFYKSSPS